MKVNIRELNRAVFASQEKRQPMKLREFDVPLVANWRSPISTAHISSAANST
jgi:hypothetical protein